MPYYCSSEHCKNECGRKFEWEQVWKNPEEVKFTLIEFEPFCDEKGNVIIIESQYSL